MLQVTIDIAAPSNLAYPNTSIIAAVGQAITPDVPTVTGTVNSYSINPALPTGLTLNTGNGTISGTPSASAAQGSYTVSAQNLSGSTTATLRVTVYIAAPSNLAYPQTTIIAVVHQEIMPDIPKVTGTEVSYTVNPALPAGLTVDSSRGIISGTPATATSSSTYTITAQNPGGSTSAAVKVSVGTMNSLIDLGHVNSIEAIRMEGDRVLSADLLGHWTLWSYSSGTLLANGDGNPAVIADKYNILTPKQIDMAGTTFAIGIPNGLEVRSNADGRVLSTVAYPGLGRLVPLGTNPPWWQLASDGSYLCVGSTTSLTVYSLAGMTIASKPGDYSQAKSFSMPGSVLVAIGPAGQSVIETISTADGTSTVGPSFSGQFNSWFLDGARFLTNAQNTVWVYTNTATQQAVVALPTIENLTGQGNWIWTYSAFTQGYQLDIYAIGADTPTLTYAGSVDAVAVASGTTIGLLSGGPGQLTVFDLSGSIPSRTEYTDPIAYLTTYAAGSSTQWVVANQHGALLEGAGLTATPQYLGYGTAWSIAGSAINAAVSTASGKILIFNPSVGALDQSIDFYSGKVSLSTNGTVLGASANAIDAQYRPDRTLNFYSLPSGTTIQSYPYSFQDPNRDLFDFTLADSGATIAQVSGTFQNSTWTYTRTVTPLKGSPVIWSDTPTCDLGQARSLGPILLSPDGTLIGEYSGNSLNNQCQPITATNLVKNGTLVTAVSGVGIGWIDNNRILANQYTHSSDGTVHYSGAIIYDATGAKVANPALPELKDIQTVTSDLIYDPSANTIYSLTSGQATWTGSLSNSGLGAVSGSYVVYQSGHNIVMESF
jgi:hypothetical protein